MLEKMKSEGPKDFPLLMEDMNLIYSSCLKELIRQVTIDCSERGQLLEKVWQAYLDLLLKCIDQNTIEKEGIERDHINEVTRVHKVYKAEIALMEKQASQLNKKLDGMRIQNDMLVDEMKEVVNLTKRIDEERTFWEQERNTLISERDNTAMELIRTKIELEEEKDKRNMRGSVMAMNSMKDLTKKSDIERKQSMVLGFINKGGNDLEHSLVSHMMKYVDDPASLLAGLRFPSVNEIEARASLQITDASKTDKSIMKDILKHYKRNSTIIDPATLKRSSQVT